MYGVVTVYLAVNVFPQRFWSKHISTEAVRRSLLYFWQFRPSVVYVALWRVATKGGLQIIALQNTKVKVLHVSLEKRA